MIPQPAPKVSTRYPVLSIQQRTPLPGVVASIMAMAERRPRRPTFRLDPQVLESRHSKGDLAEIAFLAKAISMGFTVCKPFSGNARFDFILTGGQTGKRAKKNTAGGGCTTRPEDDNPSRVWKVQVKSSWEPLRGRRYQIRVGSGVNGKPRRYGADEVDFIVAYVVREDVWYVIPIREINTAHCIGVFPHQPRSRGKFEKYREAWRLLKDSEK